MKKCRIIERTLVDGTKKFVIQQPHFLFKWWWVDSWMNSFMGISCNDYYDTLKEAKKNLCYFDGSKPAERVIPL